MAHAMVAILALLTGCTAGRWRPEAGIARLCHPGDSLMAHQNRSEIGMDSPLVSVSVGLDADLLFGCETCDEMPVGLLLQSGNVLMMAGSA
ncbi:hypothetical protein BC831DRAFT_456320 [Entophlyctis helioformis]|nr:hypothetical protein BC831DRAFT_456320 [Entophlyctis helioformis]